MGTYQDDFKQRGIENVKLKILHANFAPDKDVAARKWVAWQESKWQRRMFGLGVVAAPIAAVAALTTAAGLYLKK